jgi:hypothetical protein
MFRTDAWAQFFPDEQTPPILIANVLDPGLRFEDSPQIVMVPNKYRAAVGNLQPFGAVVYADATSTGPFRLHPLVVAYLDLQWPELESFYGDHVVHTVTSGPTYLPCAEIVSITLPDDAEG